MSFFQRPVPDWLLSFVYLSLFLLKFHILGSFFACPGLAAGVLWFLLLFWFSSILAGIGTAGNFPCGDGETYPLYKIPRGGFKLCTSLFFSGITVSGSRSHFPKPKEATLLYFNHPNLLCDPMLVIRSCPRMVRFIAADLLWKKPLINLLVQGAAAVPIKRKSEHEKTDNKAAFKYIVEALEKGQCLGIAPEGQSKMRTFIDDLQPGIGLMALEAVFKHLDKDPFSVKIVPCGLSYMHHCRWRSEAVVIYGKPIEVKTSFLRDHGVTPESVNPRDPSRVRCLDELMKQIRCGLESVTLNVSPPAAASAPQAFEGDWVALQRGVTAAHLYCEDEAISILKWIGLVKHFAGQLQDDATYKDLGCRLSIYQRTLDMLCLPDAFVRIGKNRVAHHRIVLLTLKLLVLGLLALPGALLFIPYWLFVGWKTSQTIAKGKVVFGSLAGKAAEAVQKYLAEKGITDLGPDTVTRHRANFDTINDNAMTIGFVWLCVLLSGSSATMAHCTGSVTSGLSLGCVVLPLLILLMTHCCESGSALLRERQALTTVTSMDDQMLLALSTERAQLKELILRLPRESMPLGDEADVIDQLPRWNCCGRAGHVNKWQMHFGLTLDSTYMAYHENLPTAVLPLPGQQPTPQCKSS